MPRYEDECFFVAPIGVEGGEVRKRSDGVLDFVVAPAAEQLGLHAVRADKVAKPGQITLQVIEHVLRARAVVADLTGANANVFYELAIRHTAKLPVVLICEAEEIDRLPFDIQQMRVIPLDHRDLASAAAAKEAIVEHMHAALDGAVDSPITTVLNLQALEQGTAVERTLAELVTRVDGLSRTTAAIERTLHRADRRPRKPHPKARSRDYRDTLTDALVRAIGHADVPLRSIAVARSDPDRARVTVGLKDGRSISLDVDESMSLDDVSNMVAYLLRQVADGGDEAEGNSLGTASGSGESAGAA